MTPGDFAKVNLVVLTHGHPDHLDLASLKQILDRSGAAVLTIGEGDAQLGGAGITATAIEEGTRRLGAFTPRAIPVQHEAILADTLPRTTAFLVNERLLNPSDSFGPPLHACAGVKALVLPVMAPS